MDPLMPVVPAYATCGIKNFFYHLFLSILYIFSVFHLPKKRLSVRRDNGVLLAQSCRSLFYLLWTKFIPAGSRVLASPFHHHSFVRMMQDSGRDIVICQQEKNVLIEPKDGDPNEFFAVVITHMLGRDYQRSWLKKWKEKNPNLLIIEDRVQGGLIHEDDTAIADISLYSSGQDKLPNFMGGGFARVHSSTHNSLYDDLAKELEMLPYETNFQRFVFLAKKIPTVLIYNWRPATYVIEKIASSLFGVDRCDLSDNYRKQNPGFMHEGFAIRPSPALLHSMDTILEELGEWEIQQVQCTTLFRTLLSHMGPDVREHVKPFGADTSCCYFFVQLPDVVNSRKFLASRGVITISNQTYIALDKKDEHLLHGMVLLPSLFPLRPEEISWLAKQLSDVWHVIGLKSRDIKI